MPKAPRGVPQVVPNTQGQDNPIGSSTDKSIINIFPAWSIIPRDGHYYTEIGKKAWLFAKLQPGRARKRINAT